MSNYHWEDGIGPKSQRKRVFEYAWLAEESNQFGTADFIEICRKTNSIPLLCVNMGTGTVEEAMHWVEYCNGTGDTYYANLRREHGYKEPFCVQYWGLGNEMFGAWQMNHMTATEYAKRAFEFAKAMKWVDPSIKLVACGYEQKTDWNIEIGKYLGNIIDYVSAHHYSCRWGTFDPNNYLQTMCIPQYMEKLTILSYAALTAGMNNTAGRVKIAWDEWNMYGWEGDELKEDTTYNLQNAIVTASVLNMFIRHSDVIGMANYSVFVNINGALKVFKEGLLKRSTYYVFLLYTRGVRKYYYPVYVESETAQVAVKESEKLGREYGNTNLSVQDEKSENIYTVQYIDAAVTVDEKGVNLFIINKDPENDRIVKVQFNGLGKSLHIKQGYYIYSDRITDANTVEEPDKVVIRAMELCDAEGSLFTLNVKKHSINSVDFIYE